MKYYTSVLGLDKVIQIKPLFYRKADKSVFCSSIHSADAQLLIRLTPEVIATNKTGFFKRGRRVGFSKQRLTRHFETLPEPPDVGIEKITEVPTEQQLKQLLKFST